MPITEEGRISFLKRLFELNTTEEPIQQFSVGVGTDIDTTFSIVELTTGVNARNIVGDSVTFSDSRNLSLIRFNLESGDANGNTITEVGFSKLNNNNILIYEDISPIEKTDGQELNFVIAYDVIS